ncbi:MAG: hypothetical protein AAFU79_23900 [Myxococcota bacterium]
MGSPMVIYSMKNPAWRKTQIEALVEMADGGRLRPYVTSRFRLADVREAAGAKLAGQVVGSCILTVDGTG